MNASDIKKVDFFNGIFLYRQKELWVFFVENNEGLGIDVSLRSCEVHLLIFPTRFLFITYVLFLTSIND